MVKLVSLHDKLHKNLTVCPTMAQAQSADLITIPVMLSEFQKLAVQFPIALTKNKATGQFVCVAMMGLLEAENLFWQDNSWDTLYSPLHITRQPFFLGQDDSQSGDQQYMVCFDSDNVSVDAVQGKALFDGNGKPTDYLQNIQSVLAQLLDGEKKIKRFIDQLLTLELLQPMNLEITFDNGDFHRVNGMYTIDETKFNALPEADICELQKQGYLQSIYAMIISLGQIYALVQRKNRRLADANLSTLKSA